MIIPVKNIARFSLLSRGSCLLLLLLSISINSHGQQAIQFSQYFSNQLVLNPAYAGYDDALSLTMVHRSQWTGVQGAPKTTTISGHTLFKNEHTGLGMNLISDEINIHKNMSFNGVYSYRIKTGSKSYLSLGLNAGINYHKSDYNSLLAGIIDPNDPSIRFEQVSETAFQFGTGLFYKLPKVEFGLSAPILYSSKSANGFNESETSSTNPHYFIFAKYKMKLSPNLKLNPSFLLKKKSDWPLAYDINLEAEIKEVLMLALSYRSKETLSTIVQVKILPQMKFGYSYDIPLSEMQKRNFNSHEIMLNYIFKYNDYNTTSPR